jgi:NADPH:quinone reductase-like Zn-dependent oxidoreductase
MLMDLPIPEIGSDDVLIRVRAAGANPADISFREGRYAQMVPLSFPAIMGSDFAGTVAQVVMLRIAFQKAWAVWRFHQLSGAESCRWNY